MSSKRTIFITYTPHLFFISIYIQQEIGGHHETSISKRTLDNSGSYTLVHKEDTSYLSVHFENFALDEGCDMKLTDGNGDQEYVLTGEGKPGLGGVFWARHVKGRLEE